MEHLSQKSIMRKEELLEYFLENYKKMDKLEQLKLGVNYVNKGNKSILESEEDMFEYLLPVVNSTKYELDEETREQIEKRME